jgi:hypothetical protein
VKKYNCVNCPFYDSIKQYNGVSFEYIDWCTYHGEETGILGWCERESTGEDDEYSDD